LSKKNRDDKLLARVDIHSSNAFVTTYTVEGGISKKAVDPTHLMALFANRAQWSTGFLPNNILVAGHTGTKSFVASWHKAKIYSVYLEDGRIEVPLPSFVFHGFGSKYSLYAVKGKKRPSENDKLFYPPLPNIFKGCGVCVGDNVFPEVSVSNINSTFDELMKSRFVNHMVNGRLTVAGSVVDFLRSLEGAKFFPVKLLVPAAPSLKHFAQHGVCEYG
jgi:PRTRC genetic system protein B